VNRSDVFLYFFFKLGGYFPKPTKKIIIIIIIIIIVNPIQVPTYQPIDCQFRSLFSVFFLPPFFSFFSFFFWGVPWLVKYFEE